MAINSIDDFYKHIPIYKENRDTPWKVKVMLDEQAIRGVCGGEKVQLKVWSSGEEKYQYFDFKLFNGEPCIHYHEDSMECILLRDVELEKVFQCGRCEPDKILIIRLNPIIMNVNPDVVKSNIIQNAKWIKNPSLIGLAKLIAGMNTERIKWEIISNWNEEKYGRRKKTCVICSYRDGRDKKCILRDLPDGSPNENYGTKRTEKNSPCEGFEFLVISNQKTDDTINSIPGENDPPDRKLQEEDFLECIKRNGGQVVYEFFAKRFIDGKFPTIGDLAEKYNTSKYIAKKDITEATEKCKGAIEYDYLQ